MGKLGLFLCYDTNVKNYRLVIREQDRRVFNDIANGLKTIETRAATGKYKGVEEGDNLTFVCGEDELVKTVTSALHFETVDDLYGEVPIKKVLPSAKNIDEAKNIHLSFPGYKAKLETYGIMAFILV